MEYLVRDRRSGKVVRSFFSADGWQFVGTRGNYLRLEQDGWRGPFAEFRADAYAVGLGSTEAFGGQTYGGPCKEREFFAIMGGRVVDALRMGENCGKPEQRRLPIIQRAERARMIADRSSPFIADQRSVRVHIAA